MSCIIYRHLQLKVSEHDNNQKCVLLEIITLGLEAIADVSLILVLHNFPNNKSILLDIYIDYLSRSINRKKENQQIVQLYIIDMPCFRKNIFTSIFYMECCLRYYCDTYFDVDLS